MSDLSVRQIASMTDEELVKDLVESGDIPACTECKSPLQESITGYRTILDDQDNKQEYCSDCYFCHKPFQDAIEAFLVNQPSRSHTEKFEAFAGLPF